MKILLILSVIIFFDMQGALQYDPPPAYSPPPYQDIVKSVATSMEDIPPSARGSERELIAMTNAAVQVLPGSNVHQGSCQQSYAGAKAYCFVLG